MPSILPWNCYDAMRSSPASNNWRQSGGDRESDYEAANELEEVA
jgi:hypothetical protein